MPLKFLVDGPESGSIPAFRRASEGADQGPPPGLIAAAETTRSPLLDSDRRRIWALPLYWSM